MKSLVFSFLSLVFALQCACAQVPTKLKHVVLEIDGITYGDGVKQTFNPSGVSAGVNVGTHPSDPSTTINGDLWYNSSINALRARINNTTVSLGSGGIGGGAGTVTDVTVISANGVSGVVANSTTTPSITLNLGHISPSSVTLTPGNVADRYSGTVLQGVGGATIVFGDLVMLSSIDSRWELVNVTAAASTVGDARGLLGIALSSSTDGGILTVLVHGLVRADNNFPIMTPGGAVYLTTGGNVTQTRPNAPGSVIRIVGHATSPYELMFQPDNAWIKLN